MISWALGSYILQLSETNIETTYVWDNLVPCFTFDDVEEEAFETHIFNRHGLAGAVLQTPL